MKKKRSKKVPSARRRSRSTPTPGTTLEIALGYIRRRWSVIPIPLKKKAPTQSAWQKLRIKSRDASKHFSAPGNVGVLLGHPSGDLIDVDLDCSEAIEIAEHFLPKTTLKSGRQSARSSHWYYVCPGSKTEQFKDGRKMILELRSDGAQTIIPPSIHPLGEEIQWDVNGEPATVDREELRQATRALAITVLLGRNWPEKGSRHDAAVATAGMLLRAGLDRSLVKKIVRRAADLGSDEEARTRANDVESTAKRLDRGEKVVGGPRLKKILGKRVVDAISRWLDTGQADGSDSSDSSDSSARKSSLADRLLSLCEDIEVFRASGGSGTAYATLSVDGRYRTVRICHRELGLLLGARYLDEFGGTCNRKAVDEVLDVLQGKAMYSRITHQVFVRVARFGGCIYLDLADDEGHVVQVSESGWKVITNPPVRFVRPNGILPLPMPSKGGSIVGLWECVNVTNEGDRGLVVGWLLGALLPEGPFPILFLNGEQGSAKSFSSTCLRSIIDPHEVDRRPLPRKLEELAMSAERTWVLCFDNLSSIRRDVSDTLCRISTGGAVPKRILYTDDDERIFKAKRPMLINGIPALANFSDLLDRAILLVLPRIREQDRLTEAELLRRFNEVHPHVLGCLLDGVSAGLRNGDMPVNARGTRMLDFVKWVHRCCEPLGFDGCTFDSHYRENKNEVLDAAIDNSAIIGPIRNLLLRQENRTFEGTVGRLHTALQNETFGDALRREEWPATPESLGKALRREAAELRRAGINIEHFKADDRKRSRLVRLWLQKRRARTKKSRRRRG